MSFVLQQASSSPLTHDELPVGVWSHFDLVELRKLGLEKFFKDHGLWREFPNFPHKLVEVPISPYVYGSFYIADESGKWPCMLAVVIAGQFDVMMPQRDIEANANLKEHSLMKYTLHHKNTNHLWLVPHECMLCVVTPMSAIYESKKSDNIISVQPSYEVRTHPHSCSVAVLSTIRAHSCLALFALLCVVAAHRSSQSCC